MPTPVAGSIPVTPVATAADFQWIPAWQRSSTSWSPDGRFFAYWELSGDEFQVLRRGLESEKGAPGRLRFLEPVTGGNCISNRQRGYSFRNDGKEAVEWSPDGRVVVAEMIGDPCGLHFAPAPTATSAPVDGLPAPGGEYWVREDVSSELCTQRHGQLLDTTGKTLVEYAWAGPSYVDAPCGPDAYWIDENTYLIPETTGQGPVLLSVSEGVVPLTDFIEDIGQPHRWRGDAWAEEDGGFVVVLIYLGQGRPLHLYHSHRGVAERIPHPHFASVSSDGRWIATSDGVEVGGPDATVWIRRVDDIGQDWTPIRGNGLLGQSLRWSPDSTRFAISGSDGISVFELPQGRRTILWSLHPYGTEGPATVRLSPWSPDGRWLVASAYDGDRSGLFLLDAAAADSRP